MSQYASRLESFNSAVTSTQEHAKRIKDMLSNGEMKANPVKAGLEIAGQVTGTGSGVLALKRGLAEHGAIRKLGTGLVNKLTGSTGASTADTGSARGSAEQTLSADPASAPAPASASAQPSVGGATADDASADPISSALSSFRNKAAQALKGAPTPAPAPTAPGDIPAPPPATESSAFDMGGVNAADLPNSVRGGAGSLLKTATSQGEDIGSSIGSRGASLGLTPGSIPAQGGGNVPGMSVGGGSGTSTAGVPSDGAQALSNAQQANADFANPDHPNNLGGTGTADGAPGQLPKKTTGSADGDGADAGDDALSGAKKALGVEGTLDETLGEVPFFGPLLEGFSLLATLGTTIAEAVTPSEKKTAPPPAPKMQGLSVGANLKASSGSGVGAF